MRLNATLFAPVLFLVIEAAIVPLSLAEAPADPGQAGDTQHLLRIIEEQQRRIEDQEARLAEQKAALQALREQVESVDARVRAAGSGEALTAASTTEPAEGHAVLEAAVSREKTDWPGSIELKGSDTRIQISGFAEIDAIHDSDAILTPAALVTQAIVTRGATEAQGSDGQTHFSVQASRLGIETRTPVGSRQLRTFTSVDWFDDFGTDKPNIRLREAYGEVNDVLFGGDLLLGQTWSTYTNLYAYPNMLEFQGPNGLLGTRHPMVRWTRPVGDGWTVKLAAEAPDTRNFEGARSKTRWPDGVFVLGWQNDALNVHGALLARDLQATGDAGSDGDLGWAATLQGRFNLPGAWAQDFVNFSVAYGDGIGGVTNDVPADGAYDPLTGELQAITQLAWLVGYQHWWNPNFYSVLSYAVVDQDTLDIQAPEAYDRTEYATANLVWTPDPNWLLGIEAAYGSREDKDGAEGSVYRTLLTSRFSF